MDVLALILACSVYPDDHLVRAVVELASQGNPYFVGDLATLVTFDHTSALADAERIVGELESQGGHPVVGLMGLPQDWAARFGRSPRDLLDACTNVWIGSTVLAKHHEACQAEHTVQPTQPFRRTRLAPPEAIRACTLDRFGAELGISGFAEAVNRYLPQQRVLFAPFAFPDRPPPAAGTDDGRVCRCNDVRRPPAKPKHPATPELDLEPAHLSTPSSAPILD